MSSPRLALTVLALCLALAVPGSAQETEILYLSGTGEDDTVDWQFSVTGGRNSGRWTTLPVPSCWELHGFGIYNYGHDPEKATEDGLYRYRFEVPPQWEGRRVFLVFEGAMTDTDVRVNGRSAGPIHQGAFYRFEHDVTTLVRLGDVNLLEVTVSKDSSDESVNAAERQADYWIFGGIFRPVYLKAVPAEFIARTAIDARADGQFAIDVFLGAVESADHVEAFIQTLDGPRLGAPFRAPVRSGEDRVRITTSVPHPRAWTAETPHLHEVVVLLKAGGETRHRVVERFGFRTVAVRPGDGLYVNGRKIRLKGVNRHSFWPDSGRTTSAALSRRDVELMKQMNMNAVRTAHYPPDEHFLTACDELGLYVLDELAGWQAPPYATAVGEKLVREMVERDVNHPSVILWNNGDEGGTNRELDDDFHLYDPQRRPLLHPYATFSGVDTAHYPDYAKLAAKLQGTTIYLPTELLHGLYDGGAGAGLDDYWALMRRSPVSAGGVLWVFSDEAVKRTDLGGALDTDGNHAPDGILGPHREKEGSFFAVRQIWSPIAIEPAVLPDSFAGRLTVENRYDFTDLDRCRFEWTLVRFNGPSDRDAGNVVVDSGSLRGPSVPPGATGVLELPLPDTFGKHDALLLSAFDASGRLASRWSWPLKTAADHRKRIFAEGRGRARGRETEGHVEMTGGDVTVAISRLSGKITGVTGPGGSVSFGNGPVLVGKNTSASLTHLRHHPDGDSYVVEASYSGNLRSVRWRMYGSGWLRLDYSYRLPDRDGHADHDFAGITFTYPEDRVVGMRWLGRGPYRVWKNRLRGPTYGVWEKAYNDTETGVTWDYPEFKGYHADFRWAVLETTEGRLTFVTDTEGLFLRVLTPRFTDAGSAKASFPPGDISFLHAIAPIGNKFQAASQLGPQSQKNLLHGDFSGTIYLYLGGDPPPP
jgi:hypothetical protein